MVYLFPFFMVLKIEPSPMKMLDRCSVYIAIYIYLHQVKSSASDTYLSRNKNLNAGASFRWIDGKTFVFSAGISYIIGVIHTQLHS